MERPQRLDVGAAAHARRLDHLAAGAPRRLGAEAGPSSPWSWSIVRPIASAVGDELVERRVDEHADELGPALAARQRSRPRCRARSAAASPARRSARRPRAGARPHARRRAGEVMPQNLIFGTAVAIAPIVGGEGSLQPEGVCAGRTAEERPQPEPVPVTQPCDCYRRTRHS